MQEKKVYSVNWNVFKAKFDGKEQKEFERLSYFLFCSEFNISIGIFRYKNQAGIETEPVQIDGKSIGFQAKFYDTKISENKDDIKKSIRIAKENNPGLQKILFYLNKEFSESTTKGKKKPVYETEIEKHIKSLGIEVEWRVPSHFELQLSLAKNSNLAQHFFSFDKSIFDLVSGLLLHTESILMPIKSKIEVEGMRIKIEREGYIKYLRGNQIESSVVVLSGVAGVGKTALIKDFCNKIKDGAPFFVFKATEFNIENINLLFANYGSFTLLDFINEHQGANEKYIVIDSAEKLSDLKSTDAFQEFLSTLLGSNWRVIFTTRYSYLDDLKFQLLNIYDASFQTLNIEELLPEDVFELSVKCKFKLPDNERLLGLLRNPFYLNEYLVMYEDLQGAISYSDFKKILWEKQISKTTCYKSPREECFLKIARERAETGRLFVKAEDCDSPILKELAIDEIIQYESSAEGYFITHDIYEEWALDKIIERNFNNSESNHEFFLSIGCSLPIRRAFRVWLSEKLLNDSAEAKLLIETTVIDDAIESFWKDEVCISTLLSNYVSVFFELFENELFENNQGFLKRIVFLLRIACKEVDDKLIKQLGFKKKTVHVFKTVFTKPKGFGWNHAIDFIYKHKEKIRLQNINIFLPLLEDWNNKNSSGETTQKASQIALFYYEQITENDVFRHHVSSAIKQQLTKVILQGASEIKDELKVIFDEIIAEKQTSHNSKYYSIIKTILTSLTDGIQAVKSLPEYVIKLADLFWFRTCQETRRYRRDDIEDCFGLSGKHEFNYFPASAFQTPMLQLLRFSNKEAIDFILSFTNKCVESYAKSRFKDELEKVEVYVNSSDPIEQYISNRLWGMYRGGQVSTYLLESMHMALEKWLLENAKSASKEVLESWCLYLIRNSVSASITAVVASVVLANPSKLFDVAKVLFQTKKFFIYDTRRMTLEVQQKSVLEVFRFSSLGNYEKELYENERIKSCDEPHRKFTLEHIAFNFQAFKTEEESDEEVNERREVTWAILDKYYLELSAVSNETESDKTWRMYLARMDWRKMKPTLEEKDGQTLIMLNPELAPELKEFSEKSINESSESMKYLSLRTWSQCKFKRDEDNCKQYEQYENDHQKVLAETKEIVDYLNENHDENYHLFNHSIPAYTCSVLMRDYIEKLSPEEKGFCKKVILEFASNPVRADYFYQVADGSEPAIIMLPELIKHFPEDKDEIKLLLLFLLVCDSGREMSIFATQAVLYFLWEIDYAVAQTIFLGYLFLMPKYNELGRKIRAENYEKNIYEYNQAQVIERFMKKYETEIEDVVSSKVSYSDLHELEKYDLNVLTRAFELIPQKVENEIHRSFLNAVFPLFSEYIFKDDHRGDYEIRHRILNKLAYVILNSSKEDIEVFLGPFVERAYDSSELADFFLEFISVEDRINQYYNFWIVWNAYYDKVVSLYSGGGNSYDTSQVICNYLLAWPYWKEDSKEWHSLKAREKTFYKKVARDIGHHPSVLYAICKILNEIGMSYIDDGVVWIGDILQKQKRLDLDDLEANTVYYLENIIRRYILINRNEIKKSMRIKKHVIVMVLPPKIGPHLVRDFL